MKIVGTVVLLLLVFSFQAFADVTTGNASATSDVHTTIQGSGSVTTHIETSVNGQTQTFDSNTPGDYHISMDATGTPEITSIPQSTITPSVSPKVTGAQKIKLHRNTYTFFDIDQLKNFLHHIFSWL